jgi:hypothetical protein
LEIGNHYLDGKGWQNCGQIAFEWLKSEGVDVERFKKRQAGNDAGNIRKRLKRGAGGEITVAKESKRFCLVILMLES